MHEIKKKEFEERKNEAFNHLRKILYAKEGEAFLADQDGSILPIPNHVWFSGDYMAVLNTGRTVFRERENGNMVEHEGPVLFKRLLKKSPK
jgi:hypothetical protein